MQLTAEELAEGMIVFRAALLVIDWTYILEYQGCRECFDRGVPKECECGEVLRKLNMCKCDTAGAKSDEFQRKVCCSVEFPWGKESTAEKRARIENDGGAEIREALQSTFDTIDKFSVKCTDEEKKSSEKRSLDINRKHVWIWAQDAKYPHWVPDSMIKECNGGKTVTTTPMEVKTTTEGKGDESKTTTEGKGDESRTSTEGKGDESKTTTEKKNSEGKKASSEENTDKGKTDLTYG